MNLYELLTIKSEKKPKDGEQILDFLINEIISNGINLKKAKSYPGFFGNESLKMSVDDFLVLENYALSIPNHSELFDQKNYDFTNKTYNKLIINPDYVKKFKNFERCFNFDLIKPYINLIKKINEEKKEQLKQLDGSIVEDSVKVPDIISLNNTYKSPVVNHVPDKKTLDAIDKAKKDIIKILEADNSLLENAINNPKDDFSAINSLNNDIKELNDYIKYLKSVGLIK